ncbi:MAG TPA: hypothetical protein DEO30_02420 [Lactococcus sp.]|nr:hypothetical protein [Lactococcus sp.]
MYREKISDIQDNLTEENKTYFNDLYDAIFLNGALLYKEEAMLETSYNLLLDLLDAQNDGENAIKYFGMTPDEMADNILKKWKKRHQMNSEKLFGILVFLLYFGLILAVSTGFLKNHLVSHGLAIC